MNKNAEVLSKGSMLFLSLYTVIGASGVYLAYFIGLYIETISGPQVSLLLFLALFVVVLVLAFPVAMGIAVSVAKRNLRRET